MILEAIKSNTTNTPQRIISNNHRNIGLVASVRGSVVTARFRDRLPPIHQKLRTHGEQEIIYEVVKHIDDITVQATFFCINLPSLRRIPRQ